MRVLQHCPALAVLHHPAGLQQIGAVAHFEGGEGINTLTSADQGAPLGGAVFHDNHVWVRAA